MFLLHGKIHVLGGLTRIVSLRDNQSENQQIDENEERGANGSSFTNDSLSQRYGEIGQINSSSDFTIEAAKCVQIFEEDEGIWQVVDAAEWMDIQDRFSFNEGWSLFRAAVVTFKRKHWIENQRPPPTTLDPTDDL